MYILKTVELTNENSYHNSVFNRLQTVILFIVSTYRFVEIHFPIMQNNTKSCHKKPKILTSNILHST